ncbi:peptidoglycan D,D-transpeptidase FtsI family protein [Paenibacillus allorhizosphaerae]|uniref:Penicillin-binding protein 4B n=1 Tax=Paenibacillus allorhizosphaerae TaxID=2849866 RepID=A0ABM8VQQ3_9BACL|nr:penicillin-binding protein 2 [Paenibacillus allorhizosphaerae]CAG7654495.1 Penicillin-binding protein 4B [Paenibacillus allorhizosphaerae]
MDSDSGKDRIERATPMGEEGKLKKNRIFIALLLIVSVLLLWNARLFWIQVAASRSFAGRGIDLVENSVVQREKGIVLDSGRGDFYDRSGLSLTGTTLQVLTLFPMKEELSDEEKSRRRKETAQVAQILNIPAQPLHDFINGLKSPQIWKRDGRPAALTDAEVQRIEALGLANIRVMPYKLRYGAPQAAGQVIGYIGQNPERVTRQFTDQFHKGELQLTSKIGNAGLEKTFEPWLQGIGARTVSLFTDAAKRPLGGLDLREVAPNNPYYPLKVMTTLDSVLQSRIEARMDQLGISQGAVVVLDAGNADTVAMASRPYFDPEHIDLQHEDWSNRAVKAVAPGSIFKTVTAAAALEEHVTEPGETFECDGELGEYGFTCWNKEGHGRLTLEEGFAQSCNIVFAKVAQRLGGDKLEQYARKLGLEVPVGWTGDAPGVSVFHQLDGEEKGQIYHSDALKKDGGALVQTAIGQRDVLVSPLQAANLVVTLLHQGKVLSPRIVDEIRFRNDRLYYKFPAQRLDTVKERAIKPATAKTLLEFMGEVVDSGTGQSLRSAKWELAGKSGTAQMTLKNGHPGENHWFIGYGPADHPRYAVAVLIQNVPEGQPNKSVSLFKEVMNVLAGSGQAAKS